MSVQSAADGFLRHALLEALGVEHGFGTRQGREPAGLQRVRQVHGAGVVSIDAAEAGTERLAEGDALVCGLPAVAVGVATADCVPILIASDDGRVVAAVHAGWRGLARGVIPATLRCLREREVTPDRAVAVVGPYVHACCYEVDTPVVEALRARFAEPVLAGALRASRPGHWHLELGTLARGALREAGCREERVGSFPEACTACDAVRFHSHRRDGPACGRLIHYVAAKRCGEA